MEPQERLARNIALPFGAAKTQTSNVGKAEAGSQVQAAQVLKSLALSTVTRACASHGQPRSEIGAENWDKQLGVPTGWHVF